MIIAKAKKKENIAEYLLYMWQVENLIRLLNLDIEKIKKEIIDKFDQPDTVKSEMEDWYLGLISMMKEENKIEQGHVQFIQNTVNDLNDLHLRLMSSSEDFDYKAFYALAKPGIDDLLRKSAQTEVSEIEVCFNALYGLLLLRMQSKTISPETAEAMHHISKLIAELSKKHKQIESGEIGI